MIEGSWRRRGLSKTFAYATFLILSLILLPLYRYGVNPDAISYFTISREYIAHLFPDAINGSWSPLYSWLLTPFLAVGVAGPLAARVLAIPIGLGTIFTADRLAERLGLSGDLRAGIRLALVIPVLALGFIVVTPDLLATLLMLVYLWLICSPNYLQRPAKWLAVGFVGALIYFAKAYGMWFFLGHMILTYLIWLGRRPRWRVVMAMIAGLSVFVITSAPWVAALSMKYGHFTLNTAGGYNHAIEGPTAPAFAPTEVGLLRPPTRLSASAWEDPSQLNLPDWNEFASKANFKHFLFLVARNFGDFIEQVSSYSVFLLAIGIVAAIVAVRSWQKQAGGPFGLLVLGVIIFPIGYLVLHVEQRFLSMPAVLLVLLGGWLIDHASKSYAIPRVHRTLAIWALCLSLLPNPIWSLVRERSWEGWRLQQIGDFISASIPPHSNVASDSNWFDSMYGSYYARIRYYGVPRPGENSGEFLKDIHQQGVEYLLIWNDPQKLPFLRDWQRLSPMGAEPPAIFAAKQ
ncbi:MAG TPA: hypothetical protein VG722_06615 [Tepidisphaeraceae bacterium]|nr:hypothetical protein [Tepidisphaeraceae bacterium]